MARNDTVWGIDIGNTSLRALRCRRGSEPGTIEALSFDFIEHTKILTQAGADSVELINESLTTFLSRNSIKRNKIAISVTGQNTISRFLKLPPFDKKKLKDIISYEAKLWLPFALEDVVWDYQPLVGGSMQGSTMVDTEVGMFAIKREHTSRLLAPMDKAGIPIDCIQSSLVTLYNFAAFDQMNMDELTGSYDPRNPFEYIIILCPGTDSTDVVITNGIKIWVRNFPIGGNNFTKALTKGMKLTFSNAEHLKRNVATCQDPKAVIQAMRPVFNEFLTEVNRSIEFYSSLDRKARYSKIVFLGNPGKLPGIREFLRQNLGYEVLRLSKFSKLTGNDVISAPAFVDNLGSFANCYGLALQLLGESVIQTNLIPMDVVKERLINNKKPWILAGAAALMLGLVTQFTGASTSYNVIDDALMQAAQKKAEAVSQKAKDLHGKKDTAVGVYEGFNKIGSTLTSNVEGRIIWMELFAAINAALPHGPEDSGVPLEDRDRIYVTNIEVQDVAALEEWWAAAIKSPGAYVPEPEELEAAEKALAEGGTKGSETSSSDSEMSSNSSMGSSYGSEDSETTASGPVLKSDLDLYGLEKIPKPTGPGKVVQLTLYHYHNPMNAQSFELGAEYVRRGLCKNIKFGAMPLPVSLDAQIRADAVGQTELTEVSFQELGISHPVVLDYTRPESRTIIDPAALQKLVIENAIRRETSRQKGSGRGTGGGTGRSGGMGGGMSSGMMLDNPASATMNRSMTGMGMGGDNPLAMLGGASGGSGGGSGGGMPGGGGGAMGGMSQQLSGIPDDQKLKLTRFDCVVQFVWVPTPPSEREKKREETRLVTEEKAKTLEEGGTGMETGMGRGMESEAETGTGTTNATENMDTEAPLVEE